MDVAQSGKAVVVVVVVVVEILGHE